MCIPNLGNSLLLSTLTCGTRLDMLRDYELLSISFTWRSANLPFHCIILHPKSIRLFAQVRWLSIDPSCRHGHCDSTCTRSISPCLSIKDIIGIKRKETGDVFRLSALNKVSLTTSVVFCQSRVSSQVLLLGWCPAVSKLSYRILSGRWRAMWITPVRR